MNLYTPRTFLSQYLNSGMAVKGLWLTFSIALKTELTTYLLEAIFEAHSIGALCCLVQAVHHSVGQRIIERR